MRTLMKARFKTEISHSRIGCSWNALFYLLLEKGSLCGVCKRWEDLYVLLIDSTTMTKLENEVVVTRKGQTTIPVRLRQKYKIEEGTRLEVIETEEGILFKPKKSTLDLAGSGSQYATPKEMKKLLDRLREEDVSNGLRH